MLLLIIKHEFQNGLITNIYHKEIVSIKDFESHIQAWSYPFVIKPGDDLPTAGGYGVMICYNDTDLAKAITRINNASAETENLIIEQKLMQ